MECYGFSEWGNNFSEAEMRLRSLVAVGFMIDSAIGIYKFKKLKQAA